MYLKTWEMIDMIIFAEWVGMRGKEPWERAVLVSDATTTQPRTSTRTNAGNLAYRLFLTAVLDRTDLLPTDRLLPKYFQNFQILQSSD